MRPSFRHVKDVVMLPAHGLLKAALPFPRFWHCCLRAAAAAGRGYYRLPGSHVRLTLRDFCRSTGHRDPGAIFRQFLANMVHTGRNFATLMREGGDPLAAMAEFDPLCAARLATVRERYGAAILVLPHCAGSLLPVARLGRTFPTVLLVRESASQTRSRLTAQYYARLGPEILAVRRLDPVVVARRLVKLLKQKKIVIGTTDRPAGPERGRVAVRMFDQPVWLPDWPARFSAQLQVPILPTYVRMCGGQAVMMCGEPYVAVDIASGTQRWAEYFESCFRAYPADWVLLYDKRWAAIFRTAATGASR